MRVRTLTFLAALIALALVPSTALAAPKKVFFKWSASNYSVAENAGHFDVTVQRSGNTSVATSVDVSVAGGSAVNGTQYSFSTPQTISFAAGESTKRLTVTINDNATANPPNKTVVFRITAPAGTQIKGGANATLTIVDDEGPGQIDFTTSAYTVLESGGLATIMLTRTGASNLTETVDYVAGGGTATVGADYTPTNGTVTFGPGEMTKSFQVAITDNSSAESAETVNLTLSNPQNLTAGGPPTIGANNPATLTINDDDVATFSFQSTLFSVGESAGTATITVKRGGATNVAASVNFSTSDGSATAGSDYTATSGTLEFAAGEVTKTFPVTILSDTDDEPNETVDLSLSTGETAELSIVDDDTPTESVQFSDTTYTVNEADGTATITVTLSDALGVQTTVHYATGAGGDSATAGSDYNNTSGTLTFAAGETSKTFEVPILNPGTPDPEDDESLTLTLSAPGTSLVLGDPSSATLTIADDDPPGLLDFKSLSFSVTETGGVATITVQRLSGRGGPVAVDYATSDGSATAGADYTATSGTLHWASGDSADKTFTVPVTWDGRGEGPETINLSLSNGDGADLGPNTAAVIHVADDGASGPLQLTATSYDVNEAGGATVTVTRSGGSLGGPVSVDYSTSDGSAAAGSDYTAASGTLTFGPGESSKSFTVAITGDSVHEGGESFQVKLANPGGGAALGSPASATINIADDDPAPAAPDLQSAPGSPSPAGSQTAADDKRAPKVTLSGKKVQKAFKARLLALVAKCDENCSLTVTAKAGKGRRAVTLAKAGLKGARGANAPVKLKLSKKALKKLAKLLKAGKAKVTVTVVASDLAGNKGTASRAVTVRR